MAHPWISLAPSSLISLVSVPKAAFTKALLPGEQEALKKLSKNAQGMTWGPSNNFQTPFKCAKTRV